MRCLKFILFIKLCFFPLHGVDTLVNKIFSKEKNLVNHFKKIKQNKGIIYEIKTEIKENSLKLAEKEASFAIEKDKLEFNKQNLFDKNLFFNNSKSQLQQKQELIAYNKKRKLEYEQLELANMKQYSLREFMLPVACFVVAGGMLYLKFNEKNIHFVPLFYGSYAFVNEFWRQHSELGKNREVNERVKEKQKSVNKELNSLYLEEEKLKESCETFETEYNTLSKQFSESSSQLETLQKAIFDLKKTQNDKEQEKRKIEKDIEEEKKTNKNNYSDPFQYDLYCDINDFFEEYSKTNLQALCGMLVSKYHDKKAVTFNNIQDLIENSDASQEWQNEKDIFMQTFGIPPVKEFKYEKINNIKVKKLFGYDKIVNACVEHIQSAFEQTSNKNQNIILHGPPGNGKTVLVDAICSRIDNRTSVLIFKLSPSELNTANDVNALQVQLKKLLKKKNNKVVIFIDEIDGIAPAREFEKNGENDGIVTALLTFVNNMNQEHCDDVVIVMATNYLDKVDSALTRYGRFNNKYHVGNPNYATRKAIIEELFNYAEEAIEQGLKDKVILLNFSTIGHSVATVERYACDNKDKKLTELENLFIESVVNNKKKEVQFGVVLRSEDEIKEQCNKYLKDLYANDSCIIQGIESKRKDIMSVDEVLDANRNITFKFDLDDLGIKASYEDVSFNDLIRKMIVEFINMNNVMQVQLQVSREKDQEILKTIETTNKKTEESMGVLRDLTDKLTKTFTEEVQKLNNATIEEMKHNNEKLSAEFFNTIKQSMEVSTQNIEKLAREIIEKNEELSKSIYGELASQKKGYADSIKLNEEKITGQIQSFADNVVSLSTDKYWKFYKWADEKCQELLKKIVEFHTGSELLENLKKTVETKQTLLHEEGQRMTTNT